MLFSCYVAGATCSGIHLGTVSYRHQPESTKNKFCLDSSHNLWPICLPSCECGSNICLQGKWSNSLCCNVDGNGNVQLKRTCSHTALEKEKKMYKQKRHALKTAHYSPPPPNPTTPNSVLQSFADSRQLQHTHKKKSNKNPTHQRWSDYGSRLCCNLWSVNGRWCSLRCRGCYDNLVRWRPNPVNAHPSQLHGLTQHRQTFL